MNNKLPLKFPSGEFTHTMLAEHNSQTNQEVWARYQEAIKDGKIVFIECRQLNGKGKASKVWKVADGVESTPFIGVPKIEGVTSVPIVKVVKPKPTPIVKPKVLEVVPVVAIPKSSTVVFFAKSPEIPVEVQKLIDEEEDEIESFSDIKDTGTLTDYLCPVCQQKMIAFKTATGVRLWCNQPPTICKSSENPFGHARNTKTAYQVVCDKYRFAMGTPR